MGTVRLCLRSGEFFTRRPDGSRRVIARPPSLRYNLLAVLINQRGHPLKPMEIQTLIYPANAKLPPSGISGSLSHLISDLRFLLQGTNVTITAQPQVGYRLWVAKPPEEFDDASQGQRRVQGTSGVVR